MTQHTVPIEQRRKMVPVLVVFGAFLSLITLAACVLTAAPVWTQWIR